VEVSEITAKIESLNPGEATGFVRELITKGAGEEEDLVLAKYTEYLFGKSPSKFEVFGCQMSIELKRLPELKKTSEKILEAIPEIKPLLSEEPTTMDVVSQASNFIMRERASLGSERAQTIQAVMRSLMRSGEGFEKVSERLDTYSLAKYGVKADSIELDDALSEAFGRKTP
jgi:hypothetical protein